MEKAVFILKATYLHARNLALFTFVYKTITLVLKRLRGYQHPLHTFLAAMISGYFVFGTNNKINMQVLDS